MTARWHHGPRDSTKPKAIEGLVESCMTLTAVLEMDPPKITMEDLQSVLHAMRMALSVLEGE